MRWHARHEPRRINAASTTYRCQPCPVDAPLYSIYMELKAWRTLELPSTHAHACTRMRNHAHACARVQTLRQPDDVLQSLATRPWPGGRAWLHASVGATSLWFSRGTRLRQWLPLSRMRLQWHTLLRLPRQLNGLRRGLNGPIGHGSGRMFQTILYVVMFYPETCTWWYLRKVGLCFLDTLKHSSSYTVTKRLCCIPLPGVNYNVHASCTQHAYVF